MIVNTHGQTPPCTYTVQYGDTLYTIAQAFYGKNNGDQYQQIEAANGISDPRTLKVGQQLQIPVLSSVTAGC